MYVAGQPCLSAEIKAAEHVQSQAAEDVMTCEMCMWWGQVILGAGNVAMQESGEAARTGCMGTGHADFIWVV